MMKYTKNISYFQGNQKMVQFLTQVEESKLQII